LGIYTRLFGEEKKKERKRKDRGEFLGKEKEGCV
jgi:hypothetical protein